MEKKLVKKKPEPNPEFITKCEDCKKFAPEPDSQSNAIGICWQCIDNNYGKRITTNHIPDWCPLEDYKDVKA